MKLRLATLVAALILGPGMGTAFSAQVRFPIALDYVVLQEALRAHLASTGGGQGRVLWQGGDGCHVLRLQEMQVERAGDRVRFLARGNAHVGLPFLGFCLFPVSWDGYLETVATPEIGPDWRLRFRDPSSALLDRNRKRGVVASRIWGLVKDTVDAELGAFTFDLRPPADEARAFIRSAAGSRQAATVLAALDSLRALDTRIDDQGVTVDVAMDVPTPESESSAPEPALQPAELARWQATLESLDGFLVFVVKDMGLLDPEDARLRDDLFALLFDSRQQLLAALARDSPEAGDPVRELFRSVWDRLRLIVREAAARGALKDRSLRYVTFLAAGDALSTLDALGPWLGLEVSAGGLRRLARLLEPDYAGDPLLYSEAPDPVLRELFHFHDPEAPDVPSEPEEPGTWWWLGPRAAYAEGVTEELAALVQRLDRWVPADDQLDVYRDSVGRLLDQVASRASRENHIPDRFRDLYGHLVRAVAWQESCWRQFVAKRGKVTYLLSRTGDIGIMQVNRRVWRGFFDIEKLKWNVAYNAGAGAEILGQLLTRVGVREGEAQLDNAARATYSAYNGGPGAYRRYREARVPRALRVIDEAFWDKYRAMVAGKAIDYVLCVESWPGRSARLSVAPLASGSTRSRSSRRSDATRIKPCRQAAIASRPRASCA